MFGAGGATGGASGLGAAGGTTNSHAVSPSGAGQFGGAGGGGFNFGI